MDKLRPEEARHALPRADAPGRRITEREIFCEMIAEEVRADRLTPARRKRIVRYAVQLGLSAVEAGRMIEACRLEASQSVDPASRHRALRLVEPPPAWSFRTKLALTVLGALLVHIILRAVT